MVAFPARLHKPAIAVVGAGRAGSALARSLAMAGYRIAGIWSPTFDHAVELAAAVGAAVMEPAEMLARARLTLLAVPDDALAGLSEQLAPSVDSEQPPMVAHCSGVAPAAALASLAARGALIGGFHPLAAISRRDQPLPTGITFAVEAEEPLRGALWQVAADLGGRPFDLAAASRPLYHAAAVLASNFPVVLAAQASELLQRIGIPPDAALSALVPLLQSTVDNLAEIGVPAALTGPLVRGDGGTVAQHLRALDETAPEIARVYRVLSAAALPLAQARGELGRHAIEELGRLIADPLNGEQCSVEGQTTVKV